jgi:hypothetical protein
VRVPGKPKSRGSASTDAADGGSGRKCYADAKQGAKRIGCTSQIHIAVSGSRKVCQAVQLLFAGAYQPDPSIESMLPIATVKSVIFASSSLPLLKFFGGKVELDAFQSTLRTQYAQLGAVGDAGATDFRLPQQSYPGEPRSLHLSGISLNFHFGGNWRSESPLRTWRYLPRLLSAVLN